MGLPLHINQSNEFRLLYNPYQQLFLQRRRARLADGSRAYHRLVAIAGRRGGKTLLGAISAVEEASVPNTLGWCIAPTYGDLNDYVIPAVFKVLPQSWILDGKDGWSAFNRTITLKNRSRIAFRSGDDPERMRGAGLHWLWIDEACKTNKLVWKTVEPALTEHRGAAWITTTPNGYDWVYDTFYRLASNPKYRRPGYWAVRYRTIDNPIISKEEIEEKRATNDELWFKQEYEAEFVSFEGAIYGWRVEDCILSTDEAIKEYLPDWPSIPRHLPVIIALDPGADHPFAAVKLVCTHRGLIVVDEYCKRLSAFADHVEELKPWFDGHDDVTVVIDKTAKQAQIELASHGLYASAAENDVASGIQRVKSWMKTKRLGIVEAKGGQLIEELRSYRYKNVYDSNDTSQEKLREQPFKVKDDLADALRYGVMAWPEMPGPSTGMLGRDPLTIPEESRHLWMLEQQANRHRDDGETDWETDLSQVDHFSPIGDMWV
jgi:hypothetical protein